MNITTEMDLLRGQIVITDPLYLKEDFSFDEDQSAEMQHEAAKIFESIFGKKDQSDLDKMKLSLQVGEKDLTTQGTYLMVDLAVPKIDEDFVQRHGSISSHSALLFYDTKDLVILQPDEERFIDFLFSLESFFHCGDHVSMIDASLSESRFVHGEQWNNDRYQRQFNETYSLFDNPKYFKIK